MKKIVSISLSIVVTLSLIIAFARENVIYDAYESGVKILFNEEVVSFDLPVVTINGNTYVPLREAAEKLAVNVDWNGEKNEIMLSGKRDVEPNLIFEKMFRFKLPDKVEISNYDYFMDWEEPCFVAKIAFQEQDLEYIMSCIRENHPISSANESVKTYSLKYAGEKYDWWDISELTETVFSYGRYETGVMKKSVSVALFVAKNFDGQYYLYVIRG